jgi:membrane protein YqaA with SNARE-associated domain
MALVFLGFSHKHPFEKRGRKMARFELIARSGYAARGIVFLLVAGLALISSFAAGGPETKSALDSVLWQPLGPV